MLETQDRFGKKVTAQLPLQVLKPEARQFPLKIPDLVAAPKWTARAGRGVHGPLGHRLPAGPGLSRDRTPRQADPSLLDRARRDPAAGPHRGDRGHARRLHAPRDHGPREPRLLDHPAGRGPLDQQEAHRGLGAFPFQLARPEGDLDGGHQRPDAKKAVAEMVATLYDQSLDAYLPHDWPAGFGVFRQDSLSCDCSSRTCSNRSSFRTAGRSRSGTCR